ncbi:MAG TPA: ABC transporter permease [Chitinophagaceae bacterium]|nr:ABC transporter permease [Chitinophagaceae bacterium]
MIKTYLKIAFRNIRKNKMYSFINIAGLTTGIVCCILIGLFINSELSFDKFHKNADRITRATMEYSSGGIVTKVATTGTKVGPQFKRIFPAIEEYVRTLKFSRIVTYGDKQFTENRFYYADESFLKIFSFPLVKGDVASALNSGDKVVITASTAKKYFGATDPIGKVMRIGDKKDFIVSAVAKDVPRDSQIQFDFVINFNNLAAAKDEIWWQANYVTYFLLHDKSQLAGLQQQVLAYMKTDDVRKEAKLEGNDYLTFQIEPLTKVHLYSSIAGFEPNGNITYIYVLAAIALLILIIACVNYTNLTIAQSAGRSGEIGIRKVMGARRGELFAQFIGETLFFTLLAVILAILISIQLLPFFNTVTGKHIMAADLLSFKPIISILLAGVIISLMAGIYPALILSGSIIIKILKQGFSFSSSGNGLRKSLIVVQFVISMFLIVATIIILQQLSFIRHRNLGYDKDQVIVMPVNFPTPEQYDVLKDAVKRLPAVKSVSGAYGNPTFVTWGDGINAENGTQKISFSISAMPVDIDFIKTMNMQIVTGSDFTPSDLQLMDTSNNNKNFLYTYMLNEKAVKMIGWTPEQALGKIVDRGEKGIIKAVIKDFHFASMHEPIGPLMMFMDKSYVRNMYVKAQGGGISTLIAELGKIWKERVPNRPFEYHFLDEDFNSLYISEQRAAGIFTTFAAIAICLACLGLFGLAAFTTTRRTKEIGIRKVLGANILDITKNISKDFIVLVCLAIVIATPLAWLASKKWLQDFAYRIHIQSWVFIASGIVIILLTLATVSFHAIKAALVNPVKSLRSE